MAEERKPEPRKPTARNLPGYYPGETCPLCRKGRLAKAEAPDVGLVCPACGGSVRAAQVGDYYGQD